MNNSIFGPHVLGTFKMLSVDSILLRSEGNEFSCFARENRSLLILYTPVPLRRDCSNRYVYIWNTQGMAPAITDANTAKGY